MGSQGPDQDPETGADDENGDPGPDPGLSLDHGVPQEADPGREASLKVGVIRNRRMRGMNLLLRLLLLLLLNQHDDKVCS